MSGSVTTRTMSREFMIEESSEIKDLTTWICSGNLSVLSITAGKNKIPTVLRCGLNGNGHIGCMVYTLNSIRYQETRHQGTETRNGQCDRGADYASPGNRPVYRFRQPPPSFTRATPVQLKGADAYGGGIAREGRRSTRALGVSAVAA